MFKKNRYFFLIYDFFRDGLEKPAIRNYVNSIVMIEEHVTMEHVNAKVTNILESSVKLKYVLTNAIIMEDARLKVNLLLC